MLAHTSARTCSGGNRVRVNVHVQWQSLRANMHKWCNNIHRAQVWYRARLRACSDSSQRMLARMQW